jgi:hypothetical protein
MFPKMELSSQFTKEQEEIREEMREEITAVEERIRELEPIIQDDKGQDEMLSKMEEANQERMKLREEYKRKHKQSSKPNKRHKNYTLECSIDLDGSYWEPF